MAQVLINTSVKLGEGTLTQDALKGLNIGNQEHTHAAGDINSGTFADARIPNLNASKITAGTIADARLPAKAKPADYIVAAGSNYRKWNNGNLECWGMGRITTTSNDQTVTVKVSFGHAFVNASYSVTLGVETGWPGFVMAGYTNRAKDGVTIAAWRKDANWNDISYYANGRWK